MAVSTNSTGDGFSFSKGTVILLSQDGSTIATEDCLIVFFHTVCSPIVYFVVVFSLLLDTVVPLVR